MLVRLLPVPCLVLEAALACASVTNAEIRLPAVFSDSMVLQRDRPLPIWGRAEPNETVHVELRDAIGEVLRASDTKATGQGDFGVTLDPIAATGDPLTLVVKGQSAAIEVHEVFVGEVWICGGQSNMEFPLAASLEAKETIAAANGRVRLIKAPHRLADSPQFTIDAHWVVGTPANVGGFSGVGYFFAQQLAAKLDVPIGLISINWGGTHIEPWIPFAAFASEPSFAAEATVRAKERDRHAHCVGHERAVFDWEAGEAYGAMSDAYWTWYASRDDGWKHEWWKPIASSEGWTTTVMPSVFGTAKGTEALKDFDGMVWIRRQIDVPEAWVGHDLDVRLGTIDDSDTAWWNGQGIGRVTAQGGVPRWYGVPKENVKTGPNEVVVAVIDDGGGGGLTGSADMLSVRPRDLAGAQPISLAGAWTLRAGTAKASDTPKAPLPPRGPENPALAFRAWGSMYDGMVAPFVPYAVRGAIWYQGESNEDDPEAYRTLLPLLIRSWRTAWNGGPNPGDFHFGIVQLANYRGESPEPVSGEWAAVRDAQLETMQTTPHVGLAVTIDVGDAGDIHPRDKRSVGQRLARWAMADAYGSSEEWSGPIYRSCYRRGAELVVLFDHADGLRTRTASGTSGDAAPNGFAIATADGPFVWAQGRIEGDHVVLRADGLSEPTRACYGWSDNPTRANLVNAAGLPASGFRTDRVARRRGTLPQ